MFIAFAGLMFSSELALNQYGFFLAFAVLVDTFVVRTLLVPAIMGLAGAANWWPGYVPVAYKGEDNVEENREELEEEEGEGWSDSFERGDVSEQHLTATGAGTGASLPDYYQEVEHT
eukprot:TRINITY_DN5327_c0_g2_i3.p1 TRINITY_DN5327_c0_g2~~TRINITY_DN5327_c0_g2_i3.p1  ORF type:complete len:117 (+),score=20.13 TRINITY_DN5327_c0_g2_i3:101-451(+)